ncbi:hypothetical protein HBA54_27145 [Pelagibius litoralis]|uniref:Uncharacterized protein n=1 Tax=Pelagibius litoralis TaxID=374515 RepID=A0A967F3F1_9PROT|nr:hypothetical protein [Pelagibius litoralis]NIA72274.1 hypothetical protein [Pelagibius litoralis]
MADVVGLCNSALSKIGAARITALSESSKNANLCNELYETCRDDLLRAHTWNFAAARVKLAQAGVGPAFGFDHRYALPADWIRTVDAYQDESGYGVIKYKIEGGFILTDSDDVYLRYIKRVEDVNLMPADFREALATLLARELAVPIAQSNTLEEKLEGRFRTRLRRARTTDGLEDTADQMPESSWTAARRGSSDCWGR